MRAHRKMRLRNGRQPADVAAVAAVAAEAADFEQYWDRSGRQWVKIDAAGNMVGRKKSPAYVGVPKVGA